jgi:hypothetical protein
MPDSLIIIDNWHFLDNYNIKTALMHIYKSRIISLTMTPKESIVRHKRIIPVVVTVAAIAAYMVSGQTYFGSVLGSYSTTIGNYNGNGGIGGAGGAGGVGGNGGSNTASHFGHAGVFQSAGGGSANGGTGGSANGGNCNGIACFSISSRGH